MGEKEPRYCPKLLSHHSPNKLIPIQTVPRPQNKGIGTSKAHFYLRGRFLDDFERITIDMDTMMNQYNWTDSKYEK